MKRYFSCGLLFTTIFAGLLAGIASFTEATNAAYAATMIDQMSVEDGAASRKLAQYMVKPTDNVTPVLKELGFDPSQTLFNDDQWRVLPVERKLAIAYYYAEAGMEGSGQAFLARLSSNLSQMYQPVKSELALAALLKMESVPTKFTFKKPTKEPVLTELPTEAKNAIVVLSKFLDRGSLGSPLTFLEIHSKLTKTTIFDLAMTSSTIEELVIKTVEKIDKSARYNFLADTIEVLRNKYQAANYQKEFFPYFKKDSPPPSSGFAGSPPDKPRPDGSGPNKTGPDKPGSGNDGEVKTRDPSKSPSTKRYPEVIKEHYEDPKSRKNEKMKEDVKGFGGIIFGENLTVDKNISKPTKVNFVAGKDMSSGKLIVTLEGGNTVEYPDVLVEDIFVAKKLVTGHYKGVPDWEEGNATGIVGIQRNESKMVNVYGSTSKHLVKVYVSPVVLHPAFLDRPLGNVAINTDIMLRYSKDKLYERAEKIFGSDTRAEFEQAFGNRKWDSAYMFVDVPVTLSIEKSLIIVSRTPSAETKNLPDGLLRTSFLELRLMIKPTENTPENRYDRELCSEFYRLLPSLSRVDYNFHRLNRFVPTLALIRWAKDADFEGLPDKLVVERTQDEVFDRSKYLNFWKNNAVKLISQKDILNNLTPPNEETLTLIEEAIRDEVGLRNRRIVELETSKELKDTVSTLKFAFTEFSKCLDKIKNENLTEEERSEMSKKIEELDLLFALNIDPDASLKAKYWLELMLETKQTHK